MAKLLVANWKLNPDTESAAVALAAACDLPNAVICPPFPFLAAVGARLTNAALGAQDVFWEGKGAYTGEVSPMMLASLGVRYIIVGHSERRHILHETDEIVAKKVRAILAADLTPILCVGEPREVRDKGFSAAWVYVKEQLAKDLAFATKPVIVAYEPIWAIGTGQADTPDESGAMAASIRTAHPSVIRVLYGGSVKPQNAKSFLSRSEINGALVGGASLNADDFQAIAAAVE